YSRTSLIIKFKRSEVRELVLGWILVFESTKFPDCNATSARLRVGRGPGPAVWFGLLKLQSHISPRNLGHEANYSAYEDITKESLRPDPKSRLGIWVEQFVDDVASDSCTLPWLFARAESDSNTIVDGKFETAAERQYILVCIIAVAPIVC